MDEDDGENLSCDVNASEGAVSRVPRAERSIRSRLSLSLSLSMKIVFSLSLFIIMDYIYVYRTSSFLFLLCLCLFFYRVPVRMGVRPSLPLFKLRDSYEVMVYMLGCRSQMWENVKFLDLVNPFNDRVEK